VARIRTIKPDFWTDEKVVELSAFARLVFIGLWNFVDDAGRMEFSTKKLKMLILPSDSADMSKLLGEIRGKKLITVYQVEGKEYLQVNGFEKHQKIDKRTASKLPAPAESPRSPPTEWNGMEEEKEKERNNTSEGKPSSVDAAKPKATKLDMEEFPEDWKGFAEGEGITDAAILHDLWLDFREYWTDGKGKGTVRTDWFRTWRKWVRREKPNLKGALNGTNPNSRANRAPSAHDSFIAGASAFVAGKQ
jgi:hypothetical protein